MVSFLLNFLHPFRLIAGAAYLLHGLLWNNALACPAFADQQFYPQPCIGFMGVRPYSSHFWQRVAFYHDSGYSSLSSFHEGVLILVVVYHMGVCIKPPITLIFWTFPTNINKLTFR